MTDYIFLITIFFILFYSFKKIKVTENFFLDNEFIKVQSFHDKPTPIIGGLIIFLTFLIFSISGGFNISNLQILIFIGVVNFLVGILDDIKLIINPLIRFSLLVFLNLSLILFFDFKINDFGIFFLDYLNQFLIFKYILVLLAIFFIINGSNLIDGFNGLLGIHALLILLFLRYLLIDDQSIDQYIKIHINVLILLVFCFLCLNFPKAKIFLGDSGAYLLGSQIAALSIVIYNTSENVSPFFIAIILSYLFLEIFFSVFRKLFEKKNPFLPDGLHLHMLIFQLIKKNYKNPNPKTGFVINLFYLILISPSLIYLDNHLLCMLHFIFIILIYLGIYFFLRRRFI